MNVRLFCLILLLASQTAVAQIFTDCEAGRSMLPPFNCKPDILINSIDNLVLPGCMDSLVMCHGVPMPQPSGVVALERFVRVLRRVDPVGNDERYDTIPIRIVVADDSGQVIIYPMTDMPITQPGDTRAILYRLEIDCAYWYGAGAGLIVMELEKQNILRAYTRARQLPDSIEISDRVAVSPPPTSAYHHTSDGVSLIASRSNGVWTFDHWTCSSPDVTFDPILPVQRVVGRCWPIVDTVEFTAWYDIEATSVSDHEVVDTNWAYWNNASSALHLSPNIPRFHTLSVLDVTGSVLHRYDAAQQPSWLALPIDLSPGVHAIRIDHERGSMVRLILVSPN